MCVKAREEMRQKLQTSAALETCHGIQAGWKPGVQTYIPEKTSQSTLWITRENEIRLQFSWHSSRYFRRLKASHCFVQGFDATNFGEHTRSKTEYDIAVIFLDSIISIVTALNS